MATVPASITGSARGIARTITGFVIEDESITTQDICEPLPDQNGAIAGESSYDQRINLSITCYSASASTTAPATVGSTITYGTVKYKVDSCREAGTYNGRRRWTIEAHRYTNYPAA